MSKKNSFESLALNSLKPGRYFFSNKQDKDITAIASYYNIKVKTERFIIIHPVTLETDRIVKVTIL